MVMKLKTFFCILFFEGVDRFAVKYHKQITFNLKALFNNTST